MYFLANEACPEGLDTLFTFINGILNLIKIAIPILLIIVGSIDLGKAVMAGDEKEIKTATGMLVKRFIAAIAVFFVGTLVAVIMNLVNPTWENCLNVDKETTFEYNVIVQK